MKTMEPHWKSLKMIEKTMESDEKARFNNAGRLVWQLCETVEKHWKTIVNRWKVLKKHWKAMKSIEKAIGKALETMKKHEKALETNDNHGNQLKILENYWKSKVY